MISQLASPSVCVIDDEEEDYLPILRSLNELYVSSIHLGGGIADIPEKPFERIRLVFLDLHLAGFTGKTAASYTANFFTKIVAPCTAPVIVVIWSKYANDISSDDGETEADLLIRTLLEAEPRFKDRLIFVQMKKPLATERPEGWAKVLKTEIQKTLQNQPAIELLWAWENIVGEGCARVSQDLTSVAQTASATTATPLEDDLKSTMQRMAQAQSAGSLSPSNAPKYLLAGLTQLLMDRLEHPDIIAATASHGAWLSQKPPGRVAPEFAPAMNGLLLTSEASPNDGIYQPGTVYGISDPSKFSLIFQKDMDDLFSLWIKKTSNKFDLWKRDAKAVLIEISPVCDVAQGNRINAILVAGVIAPSSYQSAAKVRGDAFGEIAASFKLRWKFDTFEPCEVILLYCHRFKAALPATTLADGLHPWFRLRELPAAAVRNAAAAHGSRVGYASVI
jgi:hypothetical protein